jgi:uncharacterized protein (TIGR03437 family)
MEMAAHADGLLEEPEASSGRVAGGFRRAAVVLLLGPLAVCLGFAAGAAGQSAPSLVVQPIPTGQRPMGIAVGPGRGTGQRLAVVANSAENSLSVLTIEQGYQPGSVVVTSSKVTSGISSPFAVTSCSPFWGVFVVVSPSANSISFIDEQGTVKATVKVGSQPYSAACFGAMDMPAALYTPVVVYVSNYGDSSVSVVDAKYFTVTKTIPNIPGNRGLQGVAVTGDRQAANPRLWVAGTDANVVTVVNPATGAIVASIPLRAPSFLSGSVWVGSALDNSIFVFSPETLTVVSTISGIPTPQALLTTSDLGALVTTGPGNSIVSIAANGGTTTFASGIPGAAGIAGSPAPVAGPYVTGTFVLVTSPDSNRVFLIQRPPGTPSEFSVVGASFGSVQAAPGGLASVFAATGVVQSFLAQSLPLPKTLGGVSLRFGGSLTFDSTNTRWNYSSEGSLDAPLLYVGPAQVNFQVPPGITPGSSIPAQMTRPGVSTLLTTVTIAAAAPGIFTVLQNGIGQAAVLNQDNTVNFGTNPAKRGSVIQIFATGAGETTPALGAGEAAPASGNPLVLTKVQPTVTVGGKNAKVLFSGMAPGFVGLWQINAEVPADVTPSMAVPLVVTAAGVSSNTVTIAVQ